MEEMSPAVAVTLSLCNPTCENSAIGSHVEITRLKLMADAASLLSESASSVCHAEIFSSGDESYSVSEIDNEMGNLLVPGKSGGMSDLSVTMKQDGSCWRSCDAIIEEGREDESRQLVGDYPNEINNELLALDANSDISLPIAVEIKGIDNGQIVAKVISLEEQSNGNKLADDFTVATYPNEKNSNGAMLKVSVVALQLPSEMGPRKVSVRSVFELECVPLWGSVSICGNRPEMEDAVVAVPQFTKIPVKMFVTDHVIGGISQSLTHLTSHFFGVYDGHGGSQVANYCCERIHLALVDELKIIQDDMVDESIRDPLKLQWEKVFTSCFLKVDDEVGGKVSRAIPDGNTEASIFSSEPVAPETVGSTAVVAVISSSHIIVANCGDSRAVLYRGKEAISLSNDHKPNRQDEFARIEASGGKVIQWNGHRVFGVLAMSRSIGDRYLKPWIIPDPEVMFVPRAKEDECLILASDGLWDVMTNDEACEVARRRLLLWHKKNVVNSLGERGHGVDPAAQAAAEYLSMLAIQKGSKDNISVIVVDLKAQRKFKTKPC